MADAIAILSAVLPSKIVDTALGVAAQIMNFEIIRFLTGLASDGSRLEDFAMNITYKLADCS